jgi:hypothetical protein
VIKVDAKQFDLTPLSGGARQGFAINARPVERACGDHQAQTGFRFLGDA